MDNNTNSSNEKLAIASLVCGIASIFLFPLAFGSAAIIFGIMVKDRVEKDSSAYQNARLGIILGIVGLVLWIVTVAAMNLAGFNINSFFGMQNQTQSAL